MARSGVFASDVQLTFDLGSQKLEFQSLSDLKAIEFYNTFVNGLKKPRFNFASNVEPIEFGSNWLRFRFRYEIVFGETLSFVGDNVSVVSKRDGRYTITSAYIRLTFQNGDHAY